MKPIYYVKDLMDHKILQTDADNFIVTGEVMPKRGRFLVFPQHLLSALHPQIMIVDV